MIGDISYLGEIAARSFAIYGITTSNIETSDYQAGGRIKTKTA